VYLVNSDVTRITFPAPTSGRLNVVVRFPPLYSRGGPKWRNNYPEGPDHPVDPNRLEFFVETNSFSQLPLLPDSFGFLGETDPIPSYPL